MSLLDFHKRKTGSLTSARWRPCAVKDETILRKERFITKIHRTIVVHVSPNACLAPQIRFHDFFRYIFDICTDC